MTLWREWWKVVAQLRPAVSRTRSFLWLAVALAGISIRPDLLGVTSLIRALGFQGIFYHSLLDFFHSSAVNLNRLTVVWTQLVLRIHPGVLRENGRLLLVGDGLKVGKAGKKMPAVKLLYQSAEGNTKPEYIMGHSCQAVAILCKAVESVFAVPLASRIHEGLVFSNRDRRTLLDKMVLLIHSLGIVDPFYFIADAYYASRKVVLPLLENHHHLIAQVRKNSVAFLPAEQPPRRTKGRPRIYGRKIRLRNLFRDQDSMEIADSPVYGEQNVQLRFRSKDLLWRPVGVVVRFVAVVHPNRGKCILMTTDLNLAPIDLIRLYGWRFKIELSFKQALHVFGTYLYHFWMKIMTPIRRGNGNQHLHRKPKNYRDAVRRKIDAYHRHIQIGLIAQGLLQYLSAAFPKLVWQSFGSWLRTIRPGIPPSEKVVALALKNTLPDFLLNSPDDSILTKFLQERIDFNRSEGLRLAGNFP